MKKTERDIEQFYKEFVASRKKAAFMQDVIAYLLGILTAIPLSIFGAFIDRWTYGDELSQRYITFGWASLVFALLFAAFAFIFLRGKAAEEQLIEDAKDILGLKTKLR